MEHLLTPLVGLLTLMGILMILMATILLWTLLMFGGIVATWHRQWCLTDDTGVETGGYMPTRYRDGSVRRKPLSELNDELDTEADETLTEPEDKRAWSQVKQGEDKVKTFWATYDQH